MMSGDLDARNALMTAGYIPLGKYDGVFGGVLYFVVRTRLQNVEVWFACEQVRVLNRRRRVSSKKFFLLIKVLFYSKCLIERQKYD